MRILLSSDKFKGALSAQGVAQSCENALQKVFPGAVFDACPIADGGEGTTEAMVAALRGVWRETAVLDAQARPRLARYGWVPASQLAILEMSAASGLALVQDIPLQPQLASTFGTGEMLLAAMAGGASKVILGIGGSATNDGGLGVAVALGWRFFRADGSTFQPTLDTVMAAVRIERPAQALPEILVACDVDNPLLGPRGATRVYGPQKGVQEFAWFEARLAHLAHLAAAATGADHQNQPGAGAAGGLGFGLMAFADGKLTSGFELVAAQVGLAERIRQADLVFTGEGRLDEQSLQGKGPVGVAKLATSLGKKVVGIAGSVTDAPGLRECFDLLISIKPADMPLPEAMRRTDELIGTALLANAAALRALR
jgi:glycerate kinase